MRSRQDVENHGRPQDPTGPCFSKSENLRSLPTSARVVSYCSSYIAIQFLDSMSYQVQGVIDLAFCRSQVIETSVRLAEG